MGITHILRTGFPVPVQYFSAKKHNNAQRSCEYILEFIGVGEALFVHLLRLP